MKALWFIQAALFIALQAMPQNSQVKGSKYAGKADSIQCARKLAAFSSAFKKNDYSKAVLPWREIYSKWPGSSESVYQNGVTMYKSFLEAESDSLKRSAYCDTIMMIYDQRIANFGGGGKVFASKGLDLLHYRKDLQREGYGYLKYSVETEGQASGLDVLTEFIAAGASLNRNGLLSNSELRKDYLNTCKLLDAKMNPKNAKANAAVKEARDRIDYSIAGSRALSCREISALFLPKFNSRKNDLQYLKNLRNTLSLGGCEEQSFYADVSERIFQLDPSTVSAYSLAHIYLQIRDYDKCIRYYELAADSALTTDERAQCCYELSVVINNNLHQPRNALRWVNEAISLKPAWGDACIMLAIVYASASGEFDDSIRRKAVYWLAVDILEKARAIDPGVTKKADKLIEEYSEYFPDIEEIFSSRLVEGGSYPIGGWIDRTTTVRARKTGNGD